MATLNQQRGTVLQVMNDVARRMGFGPFASVSANQTSLTWAGYLNDVLAEVSDYGDWPQLYEEVVASAQGGQGIVEVNASAPVRRVMEVHFGSSRAALNEMDVSQWRQLSRSSALAAGGPRQWALVDTSGINPRLRVYPTPSTAAASARYNIACYTQPRLYGSADAAAQLPFSRPLLVNGLFARTLTDESTFQMTQQAQAVFTLFRTQLREEYNRNVSDAGAGTVTLKVPNLWR